MININKNTLLIGALIVVSIITVLLWITRPKCDMIGAFSKGYKMGASTREGYSNWDSFHIPENELKFPDRSHNCPPGFTKVTDGSAKGMCAPDKYIPSPDKNTNYGSKFTSKVNGRCPSGTVEVTSGGHKGQCYKGGSSGSSNKPKPKPSPSGDTNYGSSFTSKVNGRCPSGTVEVTSGGHRGQCHKGGSSGSSGSSIEKKYPYWGWGPHDGLRCMYSDNTGCNTKYDANGNLVEM